MKYKEWLDVWFANYIKPSSKVGKINVDEQPELAEQFQVMSIPMLAVIKNGKLENQVVGYRPKEQIEAML